MTIFETYELLKNRIGWKQSPGATLVVNAENLTSESLRWFQDEHNGVTLTNIHATIETVNATDAQLNEYLADFRKQAIIHVVSNVFDSTTIKTISNVSAFDNAISQRAAIIVLEMIINSTRSNLTERLLKNSNKWFYDLNGGNGNENFPKLIGLKQRYAEEIRRLRQQFSTGRTLTSHTLAIGDVTLNETLF